MTPLDRLVKAAHMALERKQRLLNACELDDTHEIVIRLKPRGDAIRASVHVETAEREV